eukprot:gene3199-2651_t
MKNAVWKMHLRLAQDAAAAGRRRLWSAASAALLACDPATLPVGELCALYARE